MRAVVFDLWDTLVAWPVAEADVLRQRTATLVGRRRGGARAPLAGDVPALADGAARGGLPRDRHSGRAYRRARIVEQHEFARRVLRPLCGAVAALRKLRRRGVKLAVLSNCSEDVPAVWPASELRGPSTPRVRSRPPAADEPHREIYAVT